jgi:hypothetical protein
VLTEGEEWPPQASVHSLNLSPSRILDIFYTFSGGGGGGFPQECYSKGIKQELILECLLPSEIMLHNNTAGNQEGSLIK